jgi:hypothetical protein
MPVSKGLVSRRPSALLPPHQGSDPDALTRPCRALPWRFRTINTRTGQHGCRPEFREETPRLGRAVGPPDDDRDRTAHARMNPKQPRGRGSAAELIHRCCRPAILHLGSARGRRQDFRSWGFERNSFLHDLIGTRLCGAAAREACADLAHAPVVGRTLIC